MFRKGRGHWLATAALSTLLVFLTPAFLFATNPTLGNGTDPANASLAPGGAATMADAFTLQTSAATDTVTNVTVTLAAGTFGGLSLVEITNDAGTIVYGSAANPASNTPAIALTTTITATTTSTQYKIRVTPRTHANMPVPPGSTYSVTAFVSSWTGTGVHAEGAEHRKTDRRDIVGDTDLVKPGHRGGTEGDPPGVFRGPGRGFVDLHVDTDFGECEPGGRPADSASDHHSAHACPLPRRQSR